VGKAKNGVDKHEADADRLETDIDAIRADLDEIVDELDIRRQEVTDWRLQVRRHRKGIALVAVGAFAVIGGLVALRIWRHRDQDRPLGKIRRLRRALARMIDNPDDVARPTPHAGTKVLTATGAAMTSALGRRLVGG
jgi:hypothetical protein